MSVAWVRLPEGWDCEVLCAWLEPRGISVLPGRPFFWADQARGAGFLRIALMRPPEAFAAAATALARAVLEHAL